MRQDGRGAAGGEQNLRENSTGGVCRKWDTQERTALGIAIKTRVKTLVKYQKTQEAAIRKAATWEKLAAAAADHYSVKETDV